MVTSRAFAKYRREEARQQSERKKEKFKYYDGQCVREQVNLRVTNCDYSRSAGVSPRACPVESKKTIGRSELHEKRKLVEWWSIGDVCREEHQPVTCVVKIIDTLSAEVTEADVSVQRTTSLLKLIPDKRMDTGKRRR